MRDRIAGAFAGPGISPDAGIAPLVWPDEPTPVNGEILTPAAVLVPLVERSGGMTVLLTRRTESLNSHAGQISFPGGRREPGDPSPEETALRETEEEVGLDRRHIDLVGRLGVHETGTGYRVMPVVGLVVPPFELSLEPTEVAEVFELPLAFVLDPANHRVETRLFRGTPREFPVLPWGDYYVWGLTARLLKELSEVLRR